jgi:hypothetical protein
MLGFNGGLIGKERRLTSGRLAATGLWLPNEQSVAKRVNNWPFGPTEVPNIGDAFLGGFFAGYISHTANGVPTHALIVAPAATGASGTGYTITTMLQWRTATGVSVGASSTFDGRANTNAMITAGIAQYPAAQFCVNLSIGGYTDWYLPSQYELDIAYFNLKPSSASNNTSTGVNSYSVPARASNYSAGGTPFQTLVPAFNATGTERFVNSITWASGEITVNSTTTIDYSSGAISTALKTAVTARTRAFRRVPV